MKNNSSTPSTVTSALPAAHLGARRAARLVMILIAAAMIFIGDRLLRRQQNLVGVIFSHDAPSLLPFSDNLYERIQRKTEWNTLLAKLDRARNANDRDSFISTTYELSKFASLNLNPSDNRRREFLLDLIQRYGSDPQAIQAYLDLFEPAWRAKLRSSYAAYTDALVKFSAEQSNHGADLLLNLAMILRGRDERDLELRILRQIRQIAPPTVVTLDAMQRLLAMLPPDDPDRPKLQSDLAEFTRRRDILIASARWYARFEEANAKGDLPAMVQLRGSAPSGANNSFTASADAHLIQQNLFLGTFSEANSLRLKLADASIDDSFDPRQFMGLMPETAPMTANREVFPLPDFYSIRVQQWRGLLLAGRFKEAEAFARSVFPDATDLKVADEEARVERGDFSGLSPLARLARTQNNIPDAMRGQSNVAHTSLELNPVGAAVPADIHSHAEMWVSDQLVVIDFDADEPRGAFPKPTALEHDKEVWKDECVELFFNPDRWPDFYYQIDVNTIGAIFDARISGAGASRPQVATDSKFNLDVKAQPVARPGGWGLHIILPRQQIFPTGETVARFNVRRFRYIQVSGQPVLQMYSWVPLKEGGHHPEQFGWLVLPSAISNRETK